MGKRQVMFRRSDHVRANRIDAWRWLRQHARIDMRHVIQCRNVQADASQHETSARWYEAGASGNDLVACLNPQRSGSSLRTVGPVNTTVAFTVLRLIFTSSPRAKSGCACTFCASHRCSYSPKAKPANPGLGGRDAQGIGERVIKVQTGNADQLIHCGGKLHRLSARIQRRQIQSLLCKNLPRQPACATATVLPNVLQMFVICKPCPKDTASCSISSRSADNSSR